MAKEAPAGDDRAERKKSKKASKDKIKKPKKEKKKKPKQSNLSGGVSESYPEARKKENKSKAEDVLAAGSSRLVDTTAGPRLYETFSVSRGEGASLTGSELRLKKPEKAEARDTLASTTSKNDRITIKRESQESLVTPQGGDGHKIEKKVKSKKPIREIIQPDLSMEEGVAKPQSVSDALLEDNNLSRESEGENQGQKRKRKKDDCGKKDKGSKKLKSGKKVAKGERTKSKSRHASESESEKSGYDLEVSDNEIRPLKGRHAGTSQAHEDDDKTADTAADPGSCQIFFIDLHPTKITPTMLRYAPPPPGAEPVNQLRTANFYNARELLLEIARKRSSLQKHLGVKVGSTEPNTEVDSRLADWIKWREFKLLRAATNVARRARKSKSQPKKSQA